MSYTNGNSKVILEPQNVEAEAAVLGALLIDPDVIITLSTFLQPGDFFDSRHKLIYKAMLDLYNENKPASDNLLIEDLLKKANKLDDIGGPAYITSLITATPSSLNAKAYADLVKSAAERRRLLSGVSEIAKLAYNEEKDLDDLRGQSEKIFSEATASNLAIGLEPIRAGFDSYLDQIEYITKNDNKILGIPTGLNDLDRLLGGLQRSDLILLAGRPSMGKSSLALSILHHVSRVLNKRVGMFSLEMSKQQLINKLVAIESKIDSQRLRNGQIEENEWPIFLEATNTLSKLPIFLDDTPALSVLELRHRARRLSLESGLDLLIIDYLQLMRGDHKSENRQQEVSYISMQVKALAKELNIPILALSQLSRQCESRQDKRPLLSDLRESGSLEQDCDVAIFIYCDDKYNPDTEFPNVADLLIRKHRTGPTGDVMTYFRRATSEFKNLTVRTMPLEPYEVD